MRSYEKGFREEAIKLSDEIGVGNAAKQLGIPYYTLAEWRRSRSNFGSQAFVGSGHKREVGDEKDRRIRELEKENAELARANEILQEALGFSQRTEKSKSPSSIRVHRREQQTMAVNGNLPGAVGQRIGVLPLP